MSADEYEAVAGAQAGVTEYAGADSAGSQLSCQTCSEDEPWAGTKPCSENGTDTNVQIVSHK